MSICIFKEERESHEHFPGHRFETQIHIQTQIRTENWLKIGHCKVRNVRLATQRRKNDVTQQFKLRFSKRPLDLVRGFLFEFGVIWEVWLSWVLLWLKIGHCKARNVRLATQRRKKTSYSNFKLRFSEGFLDLFRGFLF